MSKTTSFFVPTPLGTEGALEGQTRNKAAVGGRFYTSTGPLTAPTIELQLATDNPSSPSCLVGNRSMSVEGLASILVIYSVPVC